MICVFVIHNIDYISNLFFQSIISLKNIFHNSINFLNNLNVEKVEIRINLTSCVFTVHVFNILDFFHSEFFFSSLDGAANFV